jgi:hydrogenase maturation protease
MKTLILGIGNPIVTDDSVGLRIAQQIKERKPELEVTEACSGALGLLDVVAGYDKLIIIDSLKTEGGKPGELYKLGMEDIPPASDLITSHGVDIASAFKLGKGLGYKMPQSVTIYAVEVKDNTTVGEECTREIAEKIPSYTLRIMGAENL